MVCDVVQRWLGLCKDRELGQDGSKLIGGFSWEDGGTGCCDQGGNEMPWIFSCVRASMSGSRADRHLPALACNSACCLIGT